MTRPPGGGGGRAILVAAAALALAGSLGGCKKKISQSQCEQLVDHFAELVVRERYADAGPEAIAAERLRERQEAKNADEFKNCTTAVQANEHECAMKAESSDALIKCLE
ncbi:MAG: hypothetical protein KF850_30050 [Labilithrix sp.]|nr:hypothetical protein [Labilithrix sp.]